MTPPSAASAGTASTEQDLRAFLVGDTRIHGRKIFAVGAATLYGMLEFLSGDDRSRILATLAWTRWMIVPGTEEVLRNSDEVPRIFDKRGSIVNIDRY